VIVVKRIAYLSKWPSGAQVTVGLRGITD